MCSKWPSCDCPNSPFQDCITKQLERKLEIRVSKVLHSIWKMANTISSQDGSLLSRSPQRIRGDTGFHQQTQRFPHTVDRQRSKAWPRFWCCLTKKPNVFLFPSCFSLYLAFWDAVDSFLRPGKLEPHRMLFGA